MKQQMLLFEGFTTVSPNASKIATGEEKVEDLLSKFATIEISTEQRISSEELQFCEHNEKIYVETRDALKKAMYLMSTLYDKYHKTDANYYDEPNLINLYDDVEVYQTKIKKVYRRFVSRITHYFVKRHNVTLSGDEIITKYNEDTITYQIILDEIFAQLGGFTFKEKAVSEIKENCKKTIYSSTNLKITKNKLVISNFVWWSKTWDDYHELSYADSRVSPLFLALSHFMEDKVNMGITLHSIYSQLKKGTRHFDIFDKYEIGHEKISSLKFFKNGKVEIVFADNSLAEQFKTEYLL